MEEAEGANSQRYSQGNEKPGEPMFVYVSMVPADLQEKALAEAFQKAKASASRLAKAAGSSLGPLRSMRKDDPKSDAFDMQNFRGFGGEYAQYMLIRQRNANRTSGTEVVGPSPDKIDHQIRVVTSFELRAK